jgi:hypothetical protein
MRRGPHDQAREGGHLVPASPRPGGPGTARLPGVAEGDSAAQRRLRRLRRALSDSHLDQDPNHTALFVILGGLLAAGTLGVIVAGTTGFEPVVQQAVNPHRLWLLVVLAATIVGYIGYVVDYREIARAEGGPELTFRQVGTLVAGGFGLFVPRGGFALDREALALSGMPAREARVRAMSLGILEYAVLAPAAFVVAIVLLARSWPAELSVRLSWAIGVPLGTVIVLLLLRHRDSFRHFGGWRGQLSCGLDAIAHTMRLWRRPHCGLTAFVGMTVYWAAEIFALWACVAVFTGEGRPGAAHIILAFATGYALTRRALPLGGAGAVEALLPFALVATGVALPTAVLVVFTYRVANLWLPLVPAAFAVFLLRRGHVGRLDEEQLQAA